MIGHPLRSGVAVVSMPVPCRRSRGEILHIMNWTSADARRAAAAMCELAGLGDTTLHLLRFGSNAVFAVDEAHVVRVMRPTTSETEVQREVDLVCEFARLGFPTARLADIAAHQPLTAHHCLGTVWERLEEPDRDRLYRPFGQLVRTFHQRTDDLELPLEPWRPLASSDRRLAESGDHYAAEDVTMLSRWSQRIAAELDQVQPVLPGGVIHGQAEMGNVLLRAGDPVLIDFECVTTGPREWDLIDTAVTTTRFGRPEQHYRDFADAYGFDVRTWEYYDTYRRLWELCATTWLMQHAGHSPKAAQEIEIRLRSWRENNPNLRWSGVLERNPPQKRQPIRPASSSP
jgi:aminoglycoside phosphotransferase (APT) family kinase protein